MLGRSDAALDYGHIASALAVKLAIADCYACAEASDMTIAPILGVGTLPFRGHASPENADQLLTEFAEPEQLPSNRVFATITTGAKPLTLSRR